MKIKLVQTCGACPEQYEAFIYNNETREFDEIGYLRLRHGYFYAEYLPTGDVVYDSYPQGDGCFETNERQHHLDNACEELINAHTKGGESKYYYLGGYDE